MYIVTGAAGFIGSCLIAKLNELGIDDLVLVDDFSNAEKEKNYINKKYRALVDLHDFFDWVEKEQPVIDGIYHIGACSDTTEKNQAVFDELNTGYSQKIWNLCVEKQIPLVYASSAATYGNGELGYKDDHELTFRLKPLNLYGESKNDFDKWALEQETAPPAWYGLKFFNVYGPNEYHKKRMASVIFHTFNEAREKGVKNLFRSHNPKYKDGEQLRDFVYVKDVVDVCTFLMKQQPESGLYNVGTGKARTFFDLASATFRSMDKEPNIVFVDMPLDIRDKYQYFTEATMTKLQSAGYAKPFATLEEGIEDYVRNYLSPEKYY